MLTNSLKISDTTKTDISELNFFQSDQNIWHYCRADLSSVLEPLMCWFSIKILTCNFLDI